jgi:hypothetical protein
MRYTRERENRVGDVRILTNTVQTSIQAAIGK